MGVDRVLTRANVERVSEDKSGEAQVGKAGNGKRRGESDVSPSFNFN